MLLRLACERRRCSTSISPPAIQPVGHDDRALDAADLAQRFLIAERTRDGVAAARAEGRIPGRPALDREKLQAALTLVRSGLSPTRAADQVGLGRSTVYRELALLAGTTLPA